MNKKKQIINIADKKSAHNDIIIIKTDLRMPKNVEKEIILDAIAEYVLLCDSDELKSFIDEVTNTIINSCVDVLK